MLQRARAAVNHLWSSQGVGGILARGGVASFGAGVASAGAALGLQMVLARTLGIDAFGHYSYALVCVNFLALFGVMGCESATMRFVASYGGAGALGRLRGFVSWVLRVPVSLSAALGVLVILALFLPLPVAPPVRSVLRVGAVLLPLVVCLKITSAILLGTRRTASGIAVRGALRSLLIALVVGGAVYVFGQSVSARAAMVINVVVTGAVVLLSYRMAMAALPSGTLHAHPETDGRLWLRTARSLFLVTAFQTLLLYTDVLLLGALRGTRDAGIYTVVVQVASVMAFGVNAANTIAAPLIAERYALGRIDEVRRIVRLATIGMTSYGVVVALGLIVLRHPVLGLFGPEFVEGAGALIVLMGGQLMIALNGAVGFVMTMTGHERTASRYVGASALLNVGLNLLLIPPFGLIGAATATAIAVAVRSVAIGWWFRYRFEPSNGSGQG